MAVWRVTPTRSASGAMIGMVSAAWPLPEWMKKLITDCMKNIFCAAKTGLDEATSGVNACSMVSMICASRARIMVPRASAITSATLTISRAPCTKDATRLSMSSRPTRPTTMAITRNRAAISSMNQSYLTTPTTIVSKVAMKIHSTARCVRVMPAKLSRSIECSLRFSISSR
ncbi:hypothetical protein D3C85_102120 [compost metagenome]